MKKDSVERQNLFFMMLKIMCLVYGIFVNLIT